MVAVSPVFPLLRVFQISLAKHKRAKFKVVLEIPGRHFGLFADWGSLASGNSASTRGYSSSSNTCGTVGGGLVTWLCHFTLFVRSRVNSTACLATETDARSVGTLGNIGAQPETPHCRRLCY